MSNNEMPIITVDDLINFLKTFPGNMPILKSDLGLTGYNRFRAGMQMEYMVRANEDPELDADFVDHDRVMGATSEVMRAVVL